MLEDLDLSGLPDERTRDLVLGLLNLIETVTADLRAAQAEVQRLRDENNHLKGEQGKPDVQPNTSSTASNYSSTKYTRPPKKTRLKDGQGKNAKLSLSITRTEKLSVERHLLPSDAVFKGYEEVVVQEVVLRPEVILFQKEKFYSPSQRMTYLALCPRALKASSVQASKPWSCSSTTRRS